MTIGKGIFAFYVTCIMRRKSKFWKKVLVKNGGNEEILETDPMVMFGLYGAPEENWWSYLGNMQRMEN